jgi:hypothetical protein
MRHPGLLAAAAALLGIFLNVSASGQDTDDLAAISIPVDPHELATGRITRPGTPKEISAAFALVDLARRNIGIYENADLSFAMKVSFTATGAVSYTGSGTMEEIRAGRGRERWSATLGDFSILRIFQDGTAYDQKAPGPIPLRIQMLRAVLFWPFSNVLPRDRLRTKAVVWNGRSVTCVLRSSATNMEPTPSAGRYWREREYCIDPRSGLLQIYSEAPGIYVLYDYGGAPKFHTLTIPRRVTIFEGGSKVLDASVDSVEDPAIPAANLFEPTLDMSGAAVVLATPLHFFRNPPQNCGIVIDGPVSEIEPIIIHASIGNDGTVLEAEPLQAYDPLLSQSALSRVMTMNFGRPVRDRGNTTVRQQELFAEVDVLPRVRKCGS